MACGRHAFGLVELDGWLYASGGSDFSRSEYNSLERYDPVKLVSSQGSWEHVTQTYNILLCLYFEKKKEMITQNVTLSNASKGKHKKWSKNVNCNLFTHRALRSS